MICWLVTSERKWNLFALSGIKSGNSVGSARDYEMETGWYEIRDSYLAIGSAVKI